MTEQTRPRVREAPFGYTQTLVPGAKEGLSAFASAIWDPEGTVSGEIKELVFLRTSIVNRCERCTAAHTASAKRRGFTPEQIAAVSDPEQWSAHFAPEAVVALELATRLCHEAYDLGADLMERVKQHYSERQLGEILLVAGQANMYNRVGEAAKQLFADH